jgi:methionyl-tRNA formyltransferase
LILPVPVLEIARLGAINVHASLLPRWRGAAPIQRALLAGDTASGVCIMQMEAGLDTGPVYAERGTAISPDDDFGTLHDRLADLGGDLLVAVLPQIAAGGAQARAQDSARATYAHKIDKADTVLRWKRPAAEIERAVRAFRPAPGAVAHIAGDPIKVWRARVVSGASEPGAILSRGETLTVACGVDALAIEEVQPAGARRMTVAEFLRGRRLPEGARFE